MDKLQEDLAHAEHQEPRAVAALEVEPYGPRGTPNLPAQPVSSLTSAGFLGIAASRHVALCASFSAIGGLLFGYECAPLPLVQRSAGLTASRSQGVISVILVMPEFLDRFEQVSDSAPGAGFYKGLMTAMITLGAFIGAPRLQRPILPHPPPVSC